MKNVSRREFIKNSGAATLGMTVLPESITILKKGRIAGANDRIRLGLIGCGSNGVNNMKLIYEDGRNHGMNVEVVAVSDPWRIAREKANAVVKEISGRNASQHESYRDLLALDHVDAVYIGSPDHVHATQMEAAALAGKHIFVQKPMAMDMKELIRAYDAVKSSGVIVQVGTQTRSRPEIVGARELYKSGVLGKLSRVEECRNSPKPYWYRYLKDVRKEDVNWKEFLYNRPMRPFNPDEYSAWYGYSDFSHGPITNLGSHFIDTVHYITGAQFPESCVCLGGILTWKDKHKFTNPDSVQATWMYPEGFLLSSSNNCGNGMGSVRNFYGEKGMLNISNNTYTDKGAPHPDGSIEGEKRVVPVERPSHGLDWLQCMRNGGTPHAPIEAGYQHSVAGLMAVISYQTGRKSHL
jgi:predicted dehydrogenase